MGGVGDGLTYGGYEGMEDYSFCIAFLYYMLSHASFSYALHPY